MSSATDIPGGEAPKGAGDGPVLGSLVLRLRVRRRRRSVDRALAHGVSPKSSPELARRAQKLAQPAIRAQLARELANLIDAAEEPPNVWRAHGIDPPLRAGAVLAARAELVGLAERLNSHRTASIRGLAIAALLAEDPNSPIYRAPDGADVGDLARRAREAIDKPDAYPAG